MYFEYNLNACDLIKFLKHKCQISILPDSYFQTCHNSIYLYGNFKIKNNNNAHMSTSLLAYIILIQIINENKNISKELIDKKTLKNP